MRGLKWCIDDYDLTPDMTKAEQTNVIRQAFQVTKENGDRIINLYGIYLNIDLKSLMKKSRGRK